MAHWSLVKDQSRVYKEVLVSIIICNIEISANTAEFVGAHVGDGTLYRTGRSLVWELRGGLNEKEYYIEHMANLLKSLFKIEFIPKFRSGGKSGCFGIQTSKKVVTTRLLELEFVPGKKCHTVRIPDYIKKASNKIKFAFVRGYFDTDGYLRFERINNNKNYYYPKIEFCTVSRNLRDDLFSLLLELNFKPCKWGKRSFKICLSGVDNLSRFIENVSQKTKNI